MKTTRIFLFALIGINLALRAQSIPVTGDGYHYYGPNSTWSEYLKVGGHERGTDRASIVATNGNLHVDSKNGFGLYLNHYSQGKTLINPQGGNVGIGTTTPSNPLHIRSSTENHQLRLEGVDGKHTWIQYYPSGTGVINWKTGVNIYGFTIYDTTNAAYRLTISNSGNVGIGTRTPDDKLTVKGRIHAEEVKVDLSVPGPDYVFKEGYDLKSLEEVQEHIQENGHLPNIPSAQEMEENGVELGILNMKLLEKIEELTLYIIDINKRMELLEKENAELRKER